MLTCESNILIDADCAAVWDVLSNVADWPRWLPTVTEVQPLDGRPVLVGNRFFVRQPSLRPCVWQVGRVEVPHAFVWETRSPGVRMIAEHTVAPLAGGKSSVCLRFSFSGPLGRIVGLVFRGLTNRYLAQEAAALKTRVEQGQHPMESAT
jgi:hypothetical protein